MNHTPREQANAAVREFLSRRDWSSQTPARERALGAFLRLAVANGFNSVSMRRLGRELGLKAPSLYSSFPGGRDEIVAESLSWFTHEYARELLAAVEVTSTPEEYWAALIRFHLTQQLQRPEADLWNLMVASDRLKPFLAGEVREEVVCWLRLHDAMYAAAARDLGVVVTEQTMRVISTVVDGAGRWLDWDGTSAQLATLLDHAVVLSRFVLEVGTEDCPSASASELSQHGTPPHTTLSVL